MIDFPTNIRDFPLFVYQDLSTENLDLVKPYEFIFNNNTPIIAVVGFSINTGLELRFAVPLTEFIPERFQPVLSVGQLRLLTDLFKSLDSNSFFGGSFPDISLIPPSSDETSEQSEAENAVLGSPQVEQFSKREDEENGDNP